MGTLWCPRSRVNASRMRDFTVPTLWNVSMHEVYPGHFLRCQHLRQVESRVRKSTLLAPMSFVEGWAHYCEHMMAEVGFRRGDVTIKLGQLAEARRGAPRPLQIQGNHWWEHFTTLQKPLPKTLYNLWNINHSGTKYTEMTSV